jgi:hypothetical protein
VDNLKDGQLHTDLWWTDSTLEAIPCQIVQRHLLRLDEARSGATAISRVQFRWSSCLYECAGQWWWRAVWQYTTSEQHQNAFGNMHVSGVTLQYRADTAHNLNNCPNNNYAGNYAILKDLNFCN